MSNEEGIFLFVCLFLFQRVCEKTECCHVPLYFGDSVDASKLRGALFFYLCLRHVGNKLEAVRSRIHSADTKQKKTLFDSIFIGQWFTLRYPDSTTPGQICTGSGSESSVVWVAADAL